MSDQPWRLWHLISAALPTGAFQFSQGLETAIADGHISSAQDTQTWLHAQMCHNLGRVDLPIITRVYGACDANDLRQIERWDAWSIACRETDELRAEERQMAIALQQWGKSVGENWPETSGFTAQFTIAAHANGASMAETQQGYCWMWLENMCLVATKLVPLGHLSAQQILRQLAGEIEPIVKLASSIGDEDIGACMPGHLILSAKHETQPSRLFRS